MSENNDIRTGGGATVGRDANAGNDLAGRDQNRQVTNIYTGPQGDREGPVTFGDLVRVVIGDPRFRDPGLQKRVDDIEAQLDLVEAELRELKSGVYGLSVQIVNLTKLVELRNTNRQRVPYSFWQGIALAVIISLLAAYAALWLWSITGGLGELDGRIGFAIFLLLFG